MIYNTYHDNYFVKLACDNKKYIQIVGYMFVALSIYSFLKRNPIQSRGIIENATDLIKYIPLDRDTSSTIAPFLDFTKNIDFSSEKVAPQTKRMIQSGGNSNNKRCVSQSKKKYIAAQQSWRCGHCNNQLDHTYEVDHVLDLQYGGSNKVDNLIALCRNCHGKKTMDSKI